MSTQHERDSLDHSYSSFGGFEKKRRRITTVRDIMNRPLPKIDKQKVNVKDQF